MQADIDMKIKAQAIGIINHGGSIKSNSSHAQFAVSQVARKAIHWQPTDCDVNRNSNMAIELTQRSTIYGDPQGAVTRSYSRWLRAK